MSHFMTICHTKKIDYCHEFPEKPKARKSETKRHQKWCNQRRLYRCSSNGNSIWSLDNDSLNAMTDEYILKFHGIHNNNHRSSRIIPCNAFVPNCSNVSHVNTYEPRSNSGCIVSAVVRGRCGMFACFAFKGCELDGTKTRQKVNIARKEHVEQICCSSNPNKSGTEYFQSRNRRNRMHISLWCVYAYMCYCRVNCQRQARWGKKKHEKKSLHGKWKVIISKCVIGWSRPLFVWLSWFRQHTYINLLNLTFIVADKELMRLCLFVCWRFLTVYGHETISEQLDDFPVVSHNIVGYDEPFCENGRKK